MSDITRLFNNRVPTKTEVRKSVREKKNFNVKLLLKLQKEFNDLTETNTLKNKTINNIFAYLNENSMTKKISDVKQMVYILLKMNDSLLEKQNMYKSLNKGSDEIFENIRRIRNNINITILKIADYNDLDYEDLIRKTLFEKMMSDLFNRRKLKDSIHSINNNIEILNYYNFDNVDFNTILYNEFLKAKESNNKGLLNYYYKLIKHVVVIPNIAIDREKFYDILRTHIPFEDAEYLKTKDNLKNKIDSLEFDKKNNRYKIYDDFVFSMDADETKKFDDAFSIEKKDDRYIIGIHIADVYSLGYDDKVILEEQQMLRSSGYASASLKQNESKNTISLFVDIDKDGVIESYRLIPAKVKVNYNMKFSELEKIYLGKDNENDSDFHKLSPEYQKVLLEKLNLLIELYIVLENKNFIACPTLTNLASVIVSKFMMLYGCVVSNYFLENNIPYIYINGNNSNYEFSMNNKGYDTGFNDYYSYGRSTSPIIDKASCVSQVLIHKCYFGNPSDRELGRYERLLKPMVKKLNR